jgi:hypothetical protein
MGGITYGADTTATLACRIAARLREVPGASGRYEEPTEWDIVMAHDADILATDRLQIGGVTFEIVRIADAGSWRTAKVATARKLA